MSLMLCYSDEVLVGNARFWLSAMAGKPQQVGSRSGIFSPTIWRGRTKWPVSVSRRTSR